MTATRPGPPVVMPPRDTGNPSADLEQRNSFVRAFVEYAAEVPASERLTVRWPTLMTVTALVAVGAVVVGVFWSLIHPLRPGEQGPQGQKVKPPAPKVVNWASVAGWDCAAAADRGFTAEGRDGDWRTASTGGWTQDGCHGTYAVVPLEVMREKGSRRSARWWFKPPKEARTCRIAVHVPAAPGIVPTGTVGYSVSGSGGAVYANFTIDVSRQAGAWVEAGSFPVQNELTVSLDAAKSRGRSDGRLLLGQMKADCHA